MHSQSRKLVLWVAISLCGLRMIWPGDVPFILDEPQLIERARDQNATGQWTTHGLKGTQSIDYGPLPIAFYRVLLKLTSPPFGWVLLKVAAVSALTLIAVFWFFNLYPAFPIALALVPFLSPYLWFYSRDLWDNSLNIPITALCFVSALSFSARPKRWSFALVSFTATASLLVHLMALPVAVSSLALCLLTQRRWIQSRWRFVAVMLVLCVAMSWGYLGHLAETQREESPWGMRFNSVVLALSGARFFSAWALEYFFGAKWFHLIGAPAVAATGYAFFPTFYGIALLIRKGWRRQNNALGPLVLLCFGLQLVLFVLTQLTKHPHYYNGIWIAFFAAFVVGTHESATRWPRSKKLYYVYLAGLAISFFLVLGQVHYWSGNRQLHYGTTLGNQWEIANELACYPRDVPLEDQRQQSFLRGIEALRPFATCTGAPKQANHLVLRYALPENSRSGLVQLEAH